MSSKPEDTAMFLPSLPVNSLPFLNRMKEILEENQTNSPYSLSEKEKAKYRANLWIILTHAYGQCFSVVAEEEYDILKDSTFPKKLFINKGGK